MLFKSNELKTALKLHNEIVSKKESRPALCYIHIVYNSGDNFVITESCDSYKLYKKQLYFEPSPGETLNSFDIMLKPFKYSFKNTDYIYINPETKTATDGDNTILLNIFKDSGAYPFPDLNRVSCKDINTNYHDIYLNVELLKDLLKGIENKTAPHDQNIIRISVPENELKPVFFSDCLNTDNDIIMLAPARKYTSH